MRGPREIGIVGLVPPQVLRMKFLRVLDGQNQIDSGLSLYIFEENELTVFKGSIRLPFE